MATFLAWTGVLTTIAFGALSIYFYFRPRSTRRIACVVGYATLERRLHPDVRISFHGIEVDALSRLLVFVWNNGSGDIRTADIPSDNQPTLRLPDKSRILSVAVLETSSEAIAFTVRQESDNAVSLSFNYLNRGDGAVIEILADGFLRSGDLQLHAPLIGGTEAVLDELSTSTWRDVWFPVILEVASSVMVAVAGAAWYAMRAHAGLKTQRSFVIAAALALGMFSLETYVNFAPLRRRLPRFARQFIRKVAATYGLK